ncbi:hypothetical protein Back11_09010 [Paenibacillus baekrokdamisoli]|uniref:Uncharacterized protein n=1 Tax=Paenibacillus baekrokdamisoli TaxID=1712516 RepID=A0A3G9IMN1_9BACL|nr:DUF2569 family protein [Paenibacillus baekrokdamisoli]MBB3067255.1 hypothetical protein [Paenibacillus baekrokdamisoli]BBH19556.1 hypothetical protein Back11_09010 [Paenibacillus baekrokdamisoli]
MQTLKENHQSDSPLLLSGLGGWLILAQIGLWGTACSAIINIVFNILPIFNNGQWEELTDPGSNSYNSMWSIAIPYEMIGSLVLLVALAVAFTLFYRKKRLLRSFLIYFYIAYAVYSLGDYFMIQSIPEIQDLGVSDSLTALIRTLITCVIWASYYGKSIRVRNTFVR